MRQGLQDLFTKLDLSLNNNNNKYDTEKHKLFLTISQKQHDGQSSIERMQVKTRLSWRDFHPNVPNVELPEPYISGRKHSPGLLSTWGIALTLVPFYVAPGFLLLRDWILASVSSKGLP